MDIDSDLLYCKRVVFGTFRSPESYKYIGKIFPLGCFSRGTKRVVNTILFYLGDDYIYIAAICKFLNVSDVSELHARIVNESYRVSLMKTYRCQTYTIY